jgi:hypothetical protein
VRCRDLAPPAGSSLSRGGPGGLSVGTYRQGYLLLGCPGPRRLAIRKSPLLPSEGRAVRPGSDSWHRGLRTLPVLFQDRGLHVPRKPEELSGNPRGPGPPGGPGPPRVMTGSSQVSPLQLASGARTPLPRGGGVRCRHVPSCEGSGAGPAACLRLEAPRGSPAHLLAFNAVAGPGAPKSKRAACH